MEALSRKVSKSKSYLRKDCKCWQDIGRLATHLIIHHCLPSLLRPCVYTTDTILKVPHLGEDRQDQQHIKKHQRVKILSWGTLGHFPEVPLQRSSVPSEALWHTEGRESGRGNRNKGRDEETAGGRGEAESL